MVCWSFIFEFQATCWSFDLLLVAPGAVMPRACAATRREIGLAAGMPECLDVARVVVVGDAVVGDAVAGCA